MRAVAFHGPMARLSQALRESAFLTDSWRMKCEPRANVGDARVVPRASPAWVGGRSCRVAEQSGPFRFVVGGADRPSGKRHGFSRPCVVPYPRLKIRQHSCARSIDKALITTPPVWRDSLQNPLASRTPISKAQSTGPSAVRTLNSIDVQHRRWQRGGRHRAGLPRRVCRLGELVCRR